jgi:predicted nucleotidyltransferase
MIRDSFLTGSRAFGYARSDSDYDVVVRCDPGDFLETALCGNGTYGDDDVFDEASDREKEKAKHPEWSAYRFGAINFIACYTDESFEQWREATNLVCEHLMNREKAISLFEYVRGVKVQDYPRHPKQDVLDYFGAEAEISIDDVF